MAEENTGNGEGGAPEEIKVGDQTYTAEQVAQMTEQLNSYKTVQEAVDLYGVTPERFVEEARGAIGALVGLQDAGIIDKDGKIVEKRKGEAVDVDTVGKTSSAQSTSPAAPKVDDLANMILEKLSPKISEIESQLKTHQTSLNKFYRDRIQQEVRSKGLDVEDEDIHLALAESQRTQKDFWKVLESRAERRNSLRDTAIKEFAKKHNLNLEQLNELREAQADEGNLAQTIVEGKKISNSPLRKKDGNTISARDATAELFRRKGL